MYLLDDTLDWDPLPKGIDTRVCNLVNGESRAPPIVERLVEDSHRVVNEMGKSH